MAKCTKVGRVMARAQLPGRSPNCAASFLAVLLSCWSLFLIRYRLLKQEEDRVQFTARLLLCVGLQSLLSWFGRQIMASMMELYRNEWLVQRNKTYGSLAGCVRLRLVDLLTQKGGPLLGCSALQCIAAVHAGHKDTPQQSHL